MPHPTAYLSFDGTCADAMRFYERVLDARLEILMTNGASPMAEHFAPETHGRIMHARLALPDGGMLMAGDCPTNMPYEGIRGVTLTLSYDSVAEAERVFAALGDGGKVTMAMQPVFWARACGMIVDRFGTPWVVNGELQAV